MLTRVLPSTTLVGRTGEVLVQTDKERQMTLDQYKRENREQLRTAREKARSERKAREANAANDDRLFLGLLGVLFLGILSYAVATFPML